MSIIDLATAQEHLADWLACDRALAKNQSYRIGDRSYTRADAATVQERIKFWSREVDALTATGRRRRGPKVFGGRYG